LIILLEGNHENNVTYLGQGRGGEHVLPAWTGFPFRDGLTCGAPQGDRLEQPRSSGVGARLRYRTAGVVFATAGLGEGLPRGQYIRAVFPNNTMEASELVFSNSRNGRYLKCRASGLIFPTARVEEHLGHRTSWGGFFRTAPLRANLDTALWVMVFINSTVGGPLEHRTSGVVFLNIGGQLGHISSEVVFLNSRRSHPGHRRSKWYF
jgi:hypothetical protein